MDFKYDVAFSFLKEDEELAIKINEALKGRLTTFLYSERQKVLAGRDGEEAFNEVFFKESRIVVVLYRNGWGSTPWTRMEQTAIKNRAYDEGYDFTTIIPLDDPISLPAWLPKTRLYLGLKRFGVDGIVTIVETRVQEYGGTVHEESFVDKVAKKQEKVRKAQARKQLLDSYEVKSLIYAELEVLLKEFKSTMSNIENTIPDLHQRIRENKSRGIDIISTGFSLAIQFYEENYGNTYLSIKLFNGVWPDNNGRPMFDSPKLLRNEKFYFDINEQDEYGWKQEATSVFYKSSQLAERWLQMLFNEVDNYKLKERKK